VDEQDQKSEKRESWLEEVSESEQRKQYGQRARGRGIWVSLGVMGMVGWSVTLPTVLGLLLGLWIDNRWPSNISWALTLLLVGLVIGILNAWHWVDSQQKEMMKERDEDRDG